MGQHLVFATASEVIQTLSGVELNAKQIERICHKYGSIRLDKIYNGCG